METYLKEVRFYQTFGADSSLPIPTTYFSEIDEKSGLFVIVMEDLSDARMETWFSEQVEDVELALVSLASIHARFWGADELHRLDWLGRADGVKRCTRYKSILEQILPHAKVKFGELLSEYSWSVLDAWLEHWEKVRVRTSLGEKTLVHREADMRQMFFPTQRLQRFVLFDWQSPEIGWGAADACRMILTSLSQPARRKHEHTLVHLCAESLRKNGVRGVSDKTLWHQIRLSSLMIVLAHMFSLLWVETEETEIWRQEHLGALSAALEDWRLLDEINQ